MNMLDGFRKEAEASSFTDEEPEVYYTGDGKSRKGFLTPGQRFVIVLMLFVVICLLGTFILLLTGKVMPPIA